MSYVGCLWMVFRRRNEVYQTSVLVVFPLCAPGTTRGMGRDWWRRIVACIMWHWCHAARYRKSFVSGGGMLSTRDCTMRNLEMCVTSSGDAECSHSWARSAHGPQVRTHSCMKTWCHTARWIRWACGVPQCVLEQSTHRIFVFSHGGEHPRHRTLPHSHSSHAWRRCTHPSVPRSAWDRALAPQSISSPGWEPLRHPKRC